MELRPSSSAWRRPSRVAAICLELVIGAIGLSFGLPLLFSQDSASLPPTITGLPPATPPPISPTVILETGERTGSGLGPQTSLGHANEPHPFSRVGLPPRNWIDQTPAQAHAKSVGCLECHHGVEPMHKSPAVVLGCTDCHGGDATKRARDPAVDGVLPGHVRPSFPEYWRTAANPANSSTILNHENAAWIRFVNPGDLRVAEQACGLCHQNSLRHVANNMMTTGQMLWGAALYNNGGYWKKNYQFGQAYGRDGAPLKLTNPFDVTPGDDPAARHPAVSAAAAPIQPQPAGEYVADF